MKKHLYFLYLLIALLSPLKIWSQNDSLRYLFQKDIYWKLAKQPQSLNRDTLMILTLDSMFTYYTRNDNVNKSDKFDYFAKFSEIVEKSNWEKGKAILLFSNGYSFGEAGQYVKSIETLNKAESIFKKVNDLPRLAYTLIKMSVYVGRSSDSPKAIEYINQAINIAEHTGNLRMITMAYNHKGMILESKSKFKEALEVYLNYEKLNDPNLDNKLANKLNTGLMYLNLNQESKGLNYILPTFKKLPENTGHRRYLHSAVREALVMHFISNKKFNQAQIYLDEIRKLDINRIKKNDTANLNNRLDRLTLYDYKIQKGLGNFKSALKFLENYRKYEDSTKENERKNQEEGTKSQLALKEQTEKLQKTENEKLKAENEREMQFRWLLIGMSILGIFSTLYVVRTNRKLKENNKELLDKNAAITEAHLKGQTTERQRVAIDLHDNLGSTISSIKYSLEAIDRSKMNEDEVAVQENLYSLLDKAYNDVRLLSHNLLPEEFAKKGLAETLTEFVRKINKASKIKFELKMDENFGRENHKIEFELYSICMELVNNIMKHSKATNAKITLEQVPPLGVRATDASGLATQPPKGGYIRLTVSDNGIGIFKNESDGKGMKNVQARVDSINGKWTVKAIEGEGVVNEILV